MQRYQKLLKKALSTNLAASKLLIGCALFICSSIQAQLDLNKAQRIRLDNGLEVILLESLERPLVSVQMLYRVGSRNEQYGLTGISHYLEHMAFRATENFPDTDVVSDIYAVGGEWHAYTWIDQTVYYETVPSDALDLTLRIEADRMQRLLIPSDEIAAERSAVFAELHSYENDASNPLRDAVIATSLLSHPYRNNVMGTESDLNSINKAALDKHYKQYYQPANAVLTIVGDFDSSQTMKRIKQLFGGFKNHKKIALPTSIETTQKGERRITLIAESESRHFEVAYHAPAVNSNDFAAFLLVRELLAGSAGLNFHQDAGFASVRQGGMLPDDMLSWFHPTRQPFLFTISGNVAASESSVKTEQRVEQSIEKLREEPVSQKQLTQAREHLLRELVFDIETTEDAAHQLGFFAGIDALDVLLNMRELISAVTVKDVQRVARQYLSKEKRTIGWSVPSVEAMQMVSDTPEKLIQQPAVTHKTDLKQATRSDDPAVRYLSSGMPVIIEASSLTESAYLSVVYPSTQLNIPGDKAETVVLNGHTYQEFRILPEELSETIQAARESLDNISTYTAEPEVASNDPWTRLSQAIDEVSAYSQSAADTSIAPALIVAVGQLDPTTTLKQLEQAYGDIKPRVQKPQPAYRQQPKELHLSTPLPLAQGQIGYVVPAPDPSTENHDAWQIALYIFSHGYEGRLGKKAISETGLLYWINSEYETEVGRGRIIVRAGVDQEHQARVKALLYSELERMKSEPPTEPEINEAKQFLLGRMQSAAQSNTEIAQRLAGDWLTRGEITTMQSLQNRLEEVSTKDVQSILSDFTSGTVITVSVKQTVAANRPK